VIIAVTGASGFIGQRLSRRLFDDGHTVRALVRSHCPALPAGVEQIRGDLADTRALQRLLAGSDALMHLAGAVRGRTAEDFDLPNVHGTETLLHACRKSAPGTPVLFFSSLAAREPRLSHYAASKRKAEEVLSACADGPWLALRPPAVYGPGDREMLPVFRFMAMTGIAPCAGRREDRLSLVFVDDLVNAAIAWLPRRHASGATCTLHDGCSGGYGWPVLAGIVGELCHRRVRIWELPRAPMDAAASMNARLSSITGKKPMLTPGKLRELRHPDWVCDNDEIRSLLDWTPSVQLRDGLAATPGWHR